jgi:serine/threonine protein kinase
VRLRPHGRLGLYELESLVSEGGLGEVWKAHHTTSGRLVALRILPSPPPGDPFRFTRFEHDVAKLTALRHVNIAKAYELVDVDSVRALVFEWVSGESLASRMASGPLAIDEAVEVIEQVAKGLVAAHARDLVHGDVKPSNIVLCPNDTVKILDLGLIEIYEPGSMRQPGVAPEHSARLLGAITGTTAYFSPEQILGRAADSRSDVWAFGCVLYEILTGTPAFAADDFTDTMALVSSAEPEWTLVPPATPAPLVDVLRRCLKKDAAQRFQRMTDALAPIRITAGEEDAQIDMKSVLEGALEHVENKREGLQLPPAGPMRTYLRQSIGNRIRTERRGQQRRGFGDEVDPMADDIQEAIKQLNERDRSLIESRLDNLDDYDDIARRFSFPSVAAARMAVARAMKRLADVLARIKKGS